MLRGKILFSSLLLVFATSVFAGDVSECKSTSSISFGHSLRVSICPAGDFKFIRDGAGTGIDYIRVIVNNSDFAYIGEHYQHECF
jgi:hypothetical protein